MISSFHKTPSDVVDLRAEDELHDYIIRSGGLPDSGDALREWEREGLGRGLLICPWRNVPVSCWPGSPARADDATSISAAIAFSLTVACSGELPKGGYASEPIEWWRPRGRPWSVAAAAKVIGERSGMWARTQYGDVDLRRYDAANTRRRRPEVSCGMSVPGMTCSRRPSHTRDLLAAGYGLFAQVDRGWSSMRDCHGVSEPAGRDSSVVAVIGYDDRPSTRALYGESLALILPALGAWNAGPRACRGIDASIPRGSLWSPVSTLGFAVALSDSVGWPARDVEVYGD